MPPVNIPPLIEWRVRFEDRIERDFQSALPDRRVDALGRLRVGFPLKSGEHWTGLAQMQLAINPFWIPAGQKGTQNVDASALYVRHSANHVTTTLGRQRFAAGSERLFGPSEWQNLSRAFDGVRVQFRGWDAFAGIVGLSQNRPRNAKIGLISRSTPSGSTLFFWKHDDIASGRVDIGTLSQTYAKKIGKWEFDAEGAVQLGRSQGRRHEAWALHAGTSYSIDNKTKVYAEVNSASGGRNADVVRTFDNLYPTNHKFYGSMDVQSWKNMNELALGVRHKVTDKLDIHAHTHFFSLRDPRDSWYGASGSQNGGFVDPTGASGRDVGKEFDFEFNYAVDKSSTLSAGLGVFCPGKFVRNLAGDDKQVWLYIQFTRR